MKKDTKEDIVDKLVVHLAQSKAYMAERKGEDFLAWRLKCGNTTKKDQKYIKWAVEFLSTKPIYIKTEK